MNVTQGQILKWVYCGKIAKASLAFPLLMMLQTLGNKLCVPPQKRGIVLGGGAPGFRLKIFDPPWLLKSLKFDGDRAKSTIFQTYNIERQ